MNYYKYTETLTKDKDAIKLDFGNWGQYIDEYIIRYEDEFRKTYIVKVDLPEDVMPSFIKIQKVTLYEIDAAEYEAEKANSDDYLSKWIHTKTTRNTALATAVVSFRGWSFDADDTSVTRMNEILTSYATRFNMLLASGTPATEAGVIYDEVIDWKDANKTFRQLKIKELYNVYHLAVLNRDTIWKTYT